MTVKEYTDQKLKALEKAKSKDTVLKNAENKKTASDRALESMFYRALSSRNPQKIEEANDAIRKDYKEKAQTIGTIGSGNTGGLLVPTTVNDSIVKKMFYVSPMRQISTVLGDMPAQLQLPSENSLPTVAWTGETVAITESSETLDPNVLTPYKYAGLDSFSSEVLADAATNPDIASFIEDRFALAMALFENAAFVNGDGVGKPFGFRSTAITPNSVAQSNAGVAYTDVTKLKYSLGAGYRQMAVFVTSSAGLMALENVRDTQGRPIWREGLANGAPSTILGQPVYLVDEIPANLGAGTNATELWYGVFKNYFIGDRGAMRVDYGTNGTDFAQDKISLRVAKRVAGRPVIGASFSKLTGVISS